LERKQLLLAGAYLEPEAVTARLWPGSLAAYQLHTNLCGQGLRAEADAARRLPRSRREQRRERTSGGVPPPNLVC